jgi:hypothetical protein
MNTGSGRLGRGTLGVAVMILCLMAPSAWAYPPAPHHLFYGMVRDELGNPLQSQDVRVIFESSSGAHFVASVESDLVPGTNYRMAVPMDAGVTSELYKPTAMRPTVPFQMRVQIGSQVFMPIEVRADFSEMGHPGKATRLDLTLGEDSDGDGLPDRWERELIDSLAGLNSLDDVNGEDDSDGDGLSNLDEYVSGNYAYDDRDGFTLKLKRVDDGMAVLEFRALRSRSYRVLSSNDLESWVPVAFEFVDDTTEAEYDVFQSDKVEQVEIVIAESERDIVGRFFKLQVE